MKKFIHEPFVHFVILGGMLFAGHSLWQKHVAKADRTIRISPVEMERQAQIFATENQRQPSDADLEGLLFAHIEEQVLMREATRLGFGEDDTIIRRRLAQKMRFMIDDVGTPNLPSRNDLENWFNANSDKFLLPETRSFEHIYLSPKGREKSVVSDAKALLETGVPENWKTQGDAFMAGRNFVNLDQSAVQRDFGTAFSKNLFNLESNSNWQGPVYSAFGVHLVRLTDVSPGALPEFSAVQAEAETVWLDEAKRQENSDALAELIEKYHVEVEE